MPHFVIVFYKTKKGGIIGFSQQPASLQRWLLTAHKRAAITTSTQEMAGIKGLASQEELPKHKEMGLRRIKKDEEDVQKIVDTILENMTSPFSIDQCDEQLFNIATGTVAS